jgi:hypothetical protein
MQGVWNIRLRQLNQRLIAHIDRGSNPFHSRSSEISTLLDGLSGGLRIDETTNNGHHHHGGYSVPLLQSVVGC